ncbi:MAG: hypothetical protein PHO54_04050, partial [Candidatus Peribacteraceae bacterium]|nr:hypothetical protein [Candidatus Peribacteraceae bacterium]
MKYHLPLVFGLLVSLLVPSVTVTAATTTVAARLPRSTILICNPINRYMISQNEPLKEDVGQFYTVVNPALGIISRCEKNARCNIIPATFSSAGTFANIQ